MCQIEYDKNVVYMSNTMPDRMPEYMSWNVIGGIIWSKVIPFYIVWYLFISWYIFLYFLSSFKVHFFDFKCFWFLDQQNHVVSNPLRPAALLSLADEIFPIPSPLRFGWLLPVASLPDQTDEWLFPSNFLVHLLIFPHVRHMYMGWF